MEDIFCFISVMSHLWVYLTTVVTYCVFTDAWVDSQMREMSSEKKEGWKWRADQKVNTDKQNHLLKKRFSICFWVIFLDYTRMITSFHSGSASNTTMCHFAPRIIFFLFSVIFNNILQILLIVWSWYWVGISKDISLFHCLYVGICM